MFRKLIVSLCFLLPAALAQATAYAPPYTVLNSVTEFDVKPDGSYSRLVREDLRINTQEGVSALSQYPIEFNSTMQSVTVLEAYTQTRDGKRLVVNRKDEILQQSSQSADAPMFDDSKVLNVIFPGLAPGASVHVSYRLTDRQPLFPGVFSFQIWFSKNEDRESADLIVNAPRNMKLHVEAVDLPGGELAPARAGTQRWQWHAGKNVAQAPESDAVNDIDYSPRVAVSTLPSYAALAQAYAQRATTKAVVTPYIRQLANSITQGETDPRKQAQLLYDWVSKNIRYVAVYFGAGGVVPHAADKIARALYGDCKDHVTLYEALLAAKNIRSSPALIAADMSWWLPGVATPGAFNHAITWLPEWNLFVDTTAQLAPFGELSDAIVGKTALVIDDGKGQARLMTLPLSSPASDGVQVSSQMNLLADGTLDGKSTVTQSGINDYTARSMFASVTPGTEADTAGRMLANQGLQGSATFKMGNPYDLTKPFSYQTDFSLPAYVDLGGPTAVVLPIGAASVNGLASLAGWGSTAGLRRYPMPIFNGRFREDIKLTLPRGFKVLALPRQANFQTPQGQYQSSYQQDGQQILVTRELVLQGNPPLLKPADFPQLYSLIRAVSRDLRAQVLLAPEQ